MRRKVLILDDDKDLSEILEAALEYSDYQVKAVRPTDNVMEQLGEFAPDIMLVDSMLGVNEGNICREVKSNPNTSGLPIILISAYPQLLDQVEYYGCDAVILKPFDLSRLLQTIQICMSYRSGKLLD